jgi:hypothetical protein
MMELVAIWMMMAPIPVVTLLVVAISVELTVVSVMFAKIDSIRAVFTVTPLMVVTMIVIVIARMIDPHDHFLCGVCLGRHRGR